MITLLPTTVEEVLAIMSTDNPLIAELDRAARAATDGALANLLNRAKDEIEEYDRLFQLQYTRMGEATARWRKAGPGRDLTLPDLGSLLTWLMVEIDSRQAKLDAGRRT